MSACMDTEWQRLIILMHSWMHWITVLLCGQQEQGIWFRAWWHVCVAWAIGSSQLDPASWSPTTPRPPLQNWTAGSSWSLGLYLPASCQVQGGHTQVSSQHTLQLLQPGLDPAPAPHPLATHHNQPCLSAGKARVSPPPAPQLSKPPSPQSNTWSSSMSGSSRLGPN